MKTETAERQSVESFEICKEIEISAPIEIAFEATLEQLDPKGQCPAASHSRCTWSRGPAGLVPRPRRRFRPPLGPCASLQAAHAPGDLRAAHDAYPAVNHLQYRLQADGGVTRLAFLHRGMGLILPEHRDGLPKGWQHWLERIRELAEGKNKATKK